jgi:hypothetical protein
MMPNITRSTFSETKMQDRFQSEAIENAEKSERRLADSGELSQVPATCDGTTFLERQ